MYLCAPRFMDIQFVRLSPKGTSTNQHSCLVAAGRKLQLLDTRFFAHQTTQVVQTRTAHTAPFYHGNLGNVGV